MACLILSSPFRKKNRYNKEPRSSSANRELALKLLVSGDHQFTITMSGGGMAPHVVEDFLGVIKIFSDGSLVRGDESTFMPAGPCPDVPGVQWKDAVYEATHGLKVRVYKPPTTTTSGGGTGNEGKLPVLVYFHGGGYCGGAYDHPLFHSCCQRFAAELPAVVLSVQYRLDPEHRLPAAIEDGAAFFSWLCAQPQAQAAAPVGATRDHPLANPFGPGSPSLEPLPLPQALVVAPGRDLLHDHVRRYAARLGEMGKAVEVAEFAGEVHGFSVGPWSEARDELMRILKRFVNHRSVVLG